MGVPVFIGDEWTAAGWRLAGLRVMVPELRAAPVREAFEQACADSPALVLISADCARLLDPGRLTEARRRLDPAVLVVGDAADSDRPDDIAGAIRERMGVAR
ncbi:MAG: V-type ATP synthase subunit F [Wenzhouxiangellaceae bacterium]